MENPLVFFFVTWESNPAHLGLPESSPSPPRSGILHLSFFFPARHPAFPLLSLMATATAAVEPRGQREPPPPYKHTERTPRNPRFRSPLPLLSPPSPATSSSSPISAVDAGE